MTLRIIFMGTPDFSVPVLAALVGQGHEIVACYSQPPRPAGRGMEPRKSPVHEKAEQFAIPVFTPVSLKDPEEQARFAALDCDIAVVVAYGLLLPKPVLDAPRLGCWNVHASLLPRWRGAAPIQRAIEAGDKQTGVMVMRMEEGLDTGPVAMAEKIAIDENMTAGELHDALSMLGADLMVRAAAAIERGSLTLVPQAAEGVTYAAKITKEEARIDWRKPASRVHDHIRAMSPFPGAWCEMDVGGRVERVKVLQSRVTPGTGEPGTLLDDALGVACGEGAVRLVRVQRAGRQPADASDFLRGARLLPGTVFH